MPEIVFKGREFVYNHHLSVPFRPLVAHADRGIGDASLEDNLIIHGDNLHALKALLSIYAGKVDCIFIDPPYNTGNEGWSYNDNVNSPMLREWLNSNPITIEDGLRSDKWCSMMFPRLRLLYELLAETGVLLVAIDDNETHRLRGMLDDIFGPSGYMATFVWRRRIGSSMSKDWVSTDHEYVVAYAKEPGDVEVAGTERDMSKYNIPDGTGRFYASMPLTVGMTKEMRPNQWYELINPRTGKGYWPPPGRVWGFYPPTMATKIEEDRIVWPDDYPDRRMTAPRLKTYPEDAKRDRKPVSTWIEHTGRTEEGTKVLKEIFGDSVFSYPKPLSLVQHLIEQFAGPHSLVLDSFAGSGTTGHAVLAANAKDGGDRKFILVEMEDYADELTAERVRRVITGYPFKGVQREELFRERLTWTRLQRMGRLTDQLDALEVLHAPSFDRIVKTVRDGELIVTGEKDAEDQAEPLGGTFTYCTLGDPLDLDSLLTGESLPSFAALASVLFHTATNTPLPSDAIDTDALGQPGHGYLGEAAGVHVWLIYQPDLEFLKSSDAALTLAKARSIAETREGRHVVFAPARFVSQKMLNDANLPVEFAPLPFALYRVERE